LSLNYLLLVMWIVLFSLYAFDVARSRSHRKTTAWIATKSKNILGIFLQPTWTRAALSH